MTLNSTWEANSSSASQEIVRILWNPKVHYCAHNSPPFVAIVSQINKVHPYLRSFLMTQFNIILQFKPRSSKKSVRLWFPHQTFCALLASPKRTTCSAHLFKIICILRSTWRWGTRWCRWLRYCATCRKVAGSIPSGVIGIFNWHNSSGRTMALGLTQPLTEMSKR